MRNVKKKIMIKNGLKSSCSDSNTFSLISNSIQNFKDIVVNFFRGVCNSEDFLDNQNLRNKNLVSKIH